MKSLSSNNGVGLALRSIGCTAMVMGAVVSSSCSDNNGAGGYAGSSGTGTGGSSAVAGGSSGSGGSVSTGGSAGTGGAGGSNQGTGGASGSTGGASGSTGGASGSTGGSGGSGGAGASGSAGMGGGSGSAGQAGSSGGVGGSDSGAKTDAGLAGGASTDSGTKVEAGALKDFSFFLTSLAAMRRLSKSDSGFGGDFRYGQADGLAGADKICTEIAEASMPGSSVKQWRAFLSTSKANAADRIGKGPWYDRLGRPIAMTLTDLLQERPVGIHAAIKEDLPNEDGVPNHKPDANQSAVDNHHVLTGSDTKGKLYNTKGTCLDWTSSAKDNQMTGRPRIGFSWTASGRTNWISGQDEGGCGAGVDIPVVDSHGSDPSNPIVGSGGGYGAIYCFALTR